MGSKAPKAPPAPDPYAVASAQTGSNVTTAVANSWLGNANVNSPLGSVTNRQQTQRVKKIDPKTGKTVTVGGKIQYTNKPVTKRVTDPSTGKSYDIPVFQQDITLSPEQQKLLDQQNQLGASMNDLAIGQVGRLAEHLKANPNLTENLPGVRSGPANISLDGLPELADNMDEYRGRVEGALMERMNPQLKRDYDDLENRLINQGMVRGSEAFTRAMDEHGRNANDARTQIFLASGGEARAMQGEQRANRGQLFNERVTVNNDTRANVESDIGIRNQMLQERLTERNQPINEITALANGGQVTMPQFQPYNAGQVDGTPVGQYIYQSNNIQQQQARDKAAAAGNMWGNIADIAGAGIYKWSDRRLKTDIRFVYTDDKGHDWYTYRYIGSRRPEFGVMADEAAAISPNAVYRDSVTGYLYVNYGAL